MKKQLLALVLTAVAATFSVAAENDKETKEDIAKHRAMAAAHEAWVIELLGGLSAQEHEQMSGLLATLKKHVNGTTA